MTPGPPMGSDPAIAAAAALAVCQQLTALSQAMGAAATALPVSTSGWHSPAQELVATMLAVQPQRFDAIATACASASAALAAHADRLGSAAWLWRQQAQSPPFLAAELEQRAARLVDDSAHQTASTLLALARSAPARPSRLRHWLGRLESWHGEIDLGAAEATEQLTATTLQTTALFANVSDPRNAAGVLGLGSNLLTAARHPSQTAKAMIDWDTWRTNPPRAAGHLLPDLMIGLASGGTSTAARAAETLRRGRAAIATAATRDALRREAIATSATEAREALINRAVTGADPSPIADPTASQPTTSQPTTTKPTATPWHGEGDTRLTARQNAATEAFHALSAAREPDITAALRKVSETANAELAGLHHRVKEVDSLKRKLATQRATTRRPLSALLAKANDAVRYTVVIDDTNYVHGVRQVAANLEWEGFHHLAPPRNAWHSTRYRGLNTSWLDPNGGAAFEVQFHTPDSWRATVKTHAWYEEARLPHTPPARKAELQAQIAKVYQSAAIPDGVEKLSGPDLPLPSTPDAIIQPPNYTIPATLIGTISADLAEANTRLTSPTISPSSDHYHSPPHRPSLHH